MNMNWDFLRTMVSPRANLSLKDGTKMKFTGVIDRVDCYEDEENLYLKIIDYKSGNMQFDFTKILNGPAGTSWSFI